jgi:hypothetical protein
VITASEPSWIAPFTGLSPRQFGKLVTALRREGADPVRRGRPWSLPLEDRVLLVAAYWRTNLTLRQLAPLFGISKSAADRIVDHLGPALALQPRRRYRTDTVLIVDGTLVPTRDRTVAASSKNYHHSTNHQVVIDFTIASVRNLSDFPDALAFASVRNLTNLHAFSVPILSKNGRTLTEGRYAPCRRPVPRYGIERHDVVLQLLDLIRGGISRGTTAAKGCPATELDWVMSGHRPDITQSSSVTSGAHPAAGRRQAEEELTGLPRRVTEAVARLRGTLRAVAR